MRSKKKLKSFDLPFKPTNLNMQNQKNNVKT
jgi:hypothetical protein